jgi:hypothetical protein
MNVLRVFMVMALAVTLTGCLLSPGRFTSALDIRRDGRFTFTYDGQIYLLALSKLAEIGAKAGAQDDFLEQPCYEEEEIKERECTADEIAEQKKDWEESRGEREEKAKREAEMMRAMLGGIDPGDPAAAQELADRLKRQAGWDKVDYKGNGLFEVRFRTSGRLDHDFLFPTMERFPMSNFFVLANRRVDGTIRLDAAGFAAQAGGSPFVGMMTGMAGIMQAGESKKSDAPLAAPELEGTFTLTTDGEVLANNTDEGPKADPTGKRLTWAVNKRTQVPPTALVRLAP